jgi:hypothetical protein
MFACLLTYLFARMHAFVLCNFRNDWHCKSMAVLESAPKSTFTVDDEYEQLLNEVEFHCTVCEAVHEEMQVLNSKIEAVYKSVTAKTKANRDHLTTVKNWVAAYYIASDIRQAICLKKEVHQICGIDSSIVDDTYAAIKERVEFLLGYPLNNCQ